MAFDPRQINRFRYLNEEIAPSGGEFDSNATPTFPDNVTNDGVWYGDDTKANCSSTSVVLGNGASGTSPESVAIGNMAAVTDELGVAVGFSALAGLECVAVGQDSGASGSGGVAVGNLARAVSLATAIGTNSEAENAGSIVIGGGLSTIDEGISIGGNATSAAWVLNTSGPCAINSDSAMVVTSAPSNAASARWRIRLNGTNYVIPLSIDE